MSSYHYLAVEESAKVAVIKLNRPDKANAINLDMWREIGAVFKWVDETPSVRAAVLMGEGKHFCAGIDLEFLQGMTSKLANLPEGQKQESLRRIILSMQSDFTAQERCRKPVLSAIHGKCIGGGVDLVTASDMRFTCDGATFSVKEIDLGIVADVGTLQRLPQLVGDGIARELALTGREFSAEEAVSWGLVNKSFKNRNDMEEAVIAMATSIAEKSPLAVRGTKHQLLYARDHSVAAGLEHVALWNSSMLLSDEIGIAVSGFLSGRKPEYPDS